MAGYPPDDYFTTPSLSRVYELWLGSKNNWEPDREAAGMLAERCPGMRVMARENRRFVLKAVDWVARERGVRQFLDLGCGRPPRPVIHDAARSVIRDAACVYVDRDPVVILNVSALEARGAGLGALEADVRDVEGVLGSAAVRDAIDLAEPVCAILGGTLSDMSAPEARTAVAGYMAALAPGSAAVISCAWFDDEDLAGRLSGMFAGGDWRNRSREDVASFFAAGDLTIPQGHVMDVSCWPVCATSGRAAGRDAAVLGGIGLKV